MLNGILPIYKQKGYTSHDVVAKCRGILKEKKIGHTGTLDPEAEGVLPLCIGKATKVVSYLTDSDKCYEAEVILGTTTTTEDATGEVVESFDVDVTKEQVERVVQSFEGDYTQIPPMYSAIKVNGVRLYELARAGIVIERKPRQVKIYQCSIKEWISDTRFKIVVNCSKGTYIRTLCTDIGKNLGCGAHMGTLLRTKVGPYTIEDSITLDILEQNKQQANQFLTPLEALFQKYEAVCIRDAYAKALSNGNSLPKEAFSSFSNEIKEGTIVRVYDTSHVFVALYVWNTSKKQWKVEKMF